MRSFEGARVRLFQARFHLGCLPSFYSCFLFAFSLNGQLHPVLALVRPISACQPGKPCSTTDSFSKHSSKSKPGQVLSLSALFVFLCPTSFARTLESPPAISPPTPPLVYLLLTPVIVSLCYSAPAPSPSFSPYRLLLYCSEVSRSGRRNLRPISFSIVMGVSLWLARSRTGFDKCFAGILVGVLRPLLHGFR